MLKTFAPLNLSPKKIILSRTQKKNAGFMLKPGGLGNQKPLCGPLERLPYDVHGSIVAID
jgi:hypothetical protein